MEWWSDGFRKTQYSITPMLPESEGAESQKL
jgi:hypothetical protein